MTTAMQYALMAGASYISNRADINRLPAPQGWTEIVELRRSDPISGFEATIFQQGTEIVISYAGTNGNGGSVMTNPDKQADAALGLGLWSEQLGRAAAYYLEIKAINPGATISFTGHSLGGGLASLVSVFFGESAYTFDQAPFQAAALGQAQSLRYYLRTQETGIIDAATLNDLLAPLDRYITAADPNNLHPIAADTLSARQARVWDMNVQGEFLSTPPWNLLKRIGTPSNTSDIRNSTNGVSGEDLHSQSLLTAYLQSQQTAATGRALNDVTFKLTDLLGMIFSKKLYSFDTDKGEENLLERLVRHEAGVRDPGTGAITIAADAMVTRFTQDLWKIAQDGGLTLNDRHLSDALTAFAMQKYYDETQASAGYKKTLFADITGGSGGIQFDMQDVASSFTAAKGYAYFRLFLEEYYTTLDPDGSLVTSPTKDQILSALSSLRDWYIQAGV